MSVLLDTSLGDIVLDLDIDTAPELSHNFLKLCSLAYYDNLLFHNVVKNFIAQSGDPTDTGEGGEALSHLLGGPRFFSVVPSKLPRKHTTRGTLSMALVSGAAGSQFFLTLADGLDYLDGRHAPFGSVVEGLDTLDKINDAILSDDGRPLRDIVIRSAVVLDDPFPDPPGLDAAQRAVELAAQNRPRPRATVAADEELEEEGSDEEAEARKQAKEARAQALTLEMIGDLPFAEVSPPENILFVCKLNAVTTSEDLELIFSRFGPILSCEVIRDAKSGDSLMYAFIEFKNKEDAERAYVKMDNVLIDDRRIHVDFSQSVSKLSSMWVQKRGGRQRGGRPKDNTFRGGREEGSRGGTYDYGSRDRGGYKDSRTRDEKYRESTLADRKYAGPDRPNRSGDGHHREKRDAYRTVDSRTSSHRDSHDNREAQRDRSPDRDHRHKDKRSTSPRGQHRSNYSPKYREKEDRYSSTSKHRDLSPRREHSVTKPSHSHKEYDRKYPEKRKYHRENESHRSSTERDRPRDAHRSESKYTREETDRYKRERR